MAVIEIRAVSRMPMGAVYVTEAFATALVLARAKDLSCDYFGHMAAAKDTEA